MSAFVRVCEVCDGDNCSNPNPRTSLGQLPTDNPFAFLYIVIVGGQGSLSLDASPKSILSMIDGLTGWAEAVPIEDQCAVTVAHAVDAEWIARYGVLKQIHSDRVSQFVGSLRKALHRIRHRQDSYDEVPPTSEWQVRSLQPHAHHDATPCCAEAPLRRSHSCLPHFRITALCRQSQRVSRCLVSCLNARCIFQSTSVPHSR